MPRRTSSPQAPRAPAKNPSRERLHAELAYLRAHVAELERTLHDLQEQQQALRVSTATWRHVAETERARLALAEQEQASLQRRLADQIRVARELEAAIADRELDRLFAVESGAILASQLHDDMGIRFRELMERAARAYASIDTVEAEAAHDAPAPTLNLTSVRTRVVDGREQIYLDQRGSTSVPFDVATTFDALWRAMLLGQQKLYPTRVVHAQTEDALSCRYKVTKRVRGAETSWTSTMVLRRFATSTRMVMVWSAVTSPDEDGMCAGAYAEETGWTEVKPADAESQDGGSARPTSIMTTHAQLVPRWFGASGPEDCSLQAKAGNFSNLVMSATDDEMAVVGELMRDILMRKRQTPEQ